MTSERNSVGDDLLLDIWINKYEISIYFIIAIETSNIEKTKVVADKHGFWK